MNSLNYCTVVPLLRDHPVVHTKVVFEEGWSFIRGRKQCKPMHVSSGIVVLNVRWSLIRGVSQEGNYCSRKLRVQRFQKNKHESSCALCGHYLGHNRYAKILNTRQRRDGERLGEMRKGKDRGLRKGAERG